MHRIVTKTSCFFKTNFQFKQTSFLMIKVVTIFLEIYFIFLHRSLINKKLYFFLTVAAATCPKIAIKCTKEWTKQKEQKVIDLVCVCIFFLNRWSSFFDIKKFIINVDRRLLTLFVATRDHSEGGHFNLSKHQQYS